MKDLSNEPMAVLHKQMCEHYEAGRISWLEYKLLCLSYRRLEKRIGKDAMEMRPRAFLGDKEYAEHVAEEHRTMLADAWRRAIKK